MAPMTEWAWVAVGYGIAFGSVAVYVAALARRWVAVSRKGDER